MYEHVNGYVLFGSPDQKKQNYKRCVFFNRYKKGEISMNKIESNTHKAVSAASKVLTKASKEAKVAVADVITQLKKKKK
jgi:hypothetical protein